MDITRDEFNGLGSRVGGLREDFIECRSKKTQQIGSLEDGRKDQEDKIMSIFRTQEEMKIAMSGLQNRLIGIGLAMVVFIPLVTSLLSKYLR